MSETFDLFTRNNKNSGNNELNEQDQINSISISMTNTEKKKKVRYKTSARDCWEPVTGQGN